MMSLLAYYKRFTDVPFSWELETNVASIEDVYRSDVRMSRRRSYDIDMLPFKVAKDILFIHESV